MLKWRVAPPFVGMKTDVMMVSERKTDDGGNSHSVGTVRTKQWRGPTTALQELTKSARPLAGQQRRGHGVLARRDYGRSAPRGSCGGEGEGKKRRKKFLVSVPSFSVSPFRFSSTPSSPLHTSHNTQPTHAARLYRANLL